LETPRLTHSHDELAFYNKIMGQNYVFIVECGMLKKTRRSFIYCSHLTTIVHKSRKNQPVRNCGSQIIEIIEALNDFTFEMKDVQFWASDYGVTYRVSLFI